MDESPENYAPPPRLLHRGRLEKLLLGLAHRLANSSLKAQARVDQLQQQITQLEQDHSQQLKQWQLSRQSQYVSTLTQWDEERTCKWDESELLCYRFTADANKREVQLRSKAKSETQGIKATATEKNKDLDDQLQRLEDAAKQKCDSMNQKLARVAEFRGQVQQAADLSLVRHSLSTPLRTAQLALEKPTSASHALKLAESSVVSARQLSDQLQNLPLGNLVSSVWGWLLWVSILIVATLVLVFWSDWSFVLSISVSAGITCLLMLSALFGVRPFLRRAAENLYPQLQGHLQLADQYRQMAEELAMKERDAELDKLNRKFEHEKKQVAHWQQTQIEKIKQQVHTDIAELWEKTLLQNRQLDTALDRELESVDQTFDHRSSQESIQDEQQLEKIKQDYVQQQSDLKDRVEREHKIASERLRQSLQSGTQHILRLQSWYRERFPSWNRLLDPNTHWPTISDSVHLPLGTVDLSKLPAGQSSLAETLNELAETVDQTPVPDRPEPLEVPMFFSPLDDSCLVVHGEPTQQSVQKFIRSLILRGLIQIPAGRFQVCIVDPNGLGRDFGWLMALGDYDPALVTHRVWTQSNHIARQLQIIVDGAEDFIQKALRNRYPSIVEYNRDASAMAEPYRFLVWYGLPAGLDDSCWKSLLSLCDSGARCGVFPILVIDPSLDWSDPKLEWLLSRGVHLDCQPAHGLTLRSERRENLTLLPDVPPSEQDTDRLISELSLRAQSASRVEVPLAQIIGYQPGQTQQQQSVPQWSGDSSHSLQIPIGQAGIGRAQSLTLGTGTAQHAVIAGKTGSGKSSLLHAIITSAILKYSPEKLRLVLLDFKKGVELQIYSESQIPHADIIGIESHREFGLSALERVDQCLQLRGQMFRGAGVQDIAGWNRANPDQILPRVLLVIDEFQELFIEDDKIGHAAGMILDRIVRQGRSFGVHAVMSSQTLAGAYSIPRSTLNQMSVRIALVCDSSDAQIIFSDDNPAAARLKHPGQAIYNDAGGRIEGNQPMQVGWVDQKSQLEWFQQMPKGYQNQDPTTNRLGRTVVFDGNRPAKWRPESADMAIQAAAREVNREAVWCAVGDSVSINPAVVFPFSNQTGRNALLVGTDDSMGASVVDLITHSFVKSSLGRGVQARIVGIVGARPTDRCTLELGERWKRLPCELELVDRLGAEDALSQLHQLLQQRITEQSADEQPVLLNLIHLGRLTSLRREDEFSFGGSGETPDKWLEALLRDGPSHSIHVMIWAESYSVVSRWLQRSALRELEIRLLMQMSPSDSSNMMDSVAAAHLGERIMILYDEASGIEAKFRPYDFRSLHNLNRWVAESPSADGLD